MLYMLNGERQATFLESGAVGSTLRNKSESVVPLEAEEKDQWVSTSEFHDEKDVLGRGGQGLALGR